MSAKPKLGLKTLDEFRENSEANYETLPRFTTREYQDPSPLPQRSDRWYNGSLIGVGGKDPALFGPKRRLRLLHTKITSQETPGSQTRGQLYRLAGNLLSQFFSCAILDPLIEDLIACETIRLPQAMDKAICVVLAAVEMYLRRFHRTVLKEGVVAEIASELGIDVSRQKLIAAKWFLAKGGFWREHLHQINTATYEILQNLTLDITANFPFPAKNNLGGFRRQVYRRCGALISHLAETRRRPQSLEIYAHVIVSLAAGKLLNTPILTSQSLEDPQFKKRANRAKIQFIEMLGVP